MVTAAALVMGVTGAVAAPMHGSGFAGRGGGAPGGMARGGMMAAPQTSLGGQTSPGGNVKANSFAQSNNFKGNNLAVPNNNVAAAQNYRQNYRNGPNYAYMHRDHDHDHDRGRGYGYGGGYWGGGLYAFEPGYDDYYDYDDEYAGNSCYQPRWVPTPYGMRWRDVWVCD
jgi:hypothetical protein